MLYSGFNILPRSVVRSADFNGRSDNLDVIPLKMKTNYFIRTLYSPNLGARAFAANKLQFGVDEMLAHYDVLPLLIRSAKKYADPNAKGYENFISSSLRAAGAMVNSFGYDSTDRVHVEVADWIFESNDSVSIEIAASSIWALWDLGIPPLAVRNQLENLISSPPRKKPDNPNTCRAIAFRMLARLDREAARKFIGSPACTEFREAVSKWFDDYKINFPANQNIPQELYYETEWLDIAG